MLPDRGLTKLSDAQLVQEYRNGNAGAFEALVSRHEPNMIRYISSFIDSNSARDVMQDTWEAIVSAIAGGSYKEEDHFSKFIKGIAYRQAMKKQRDLHRLTYPAEELPDNPDESMNAEEYIVSREKVSSFARALKILGKRESRIFILHALRGKSFGEIARRMGIREDSARGMYRSAMEKINRWTARGKRLL